MYIYKCWYMITRLTLYCEHKCDYWILRPFHIITKFHSIYTFKYMYNHINSRQFCFGIEDLCPVCNLQLYPPCHDSSAPSMGVKWVNIKIFCLKIRLLGQPSDQKRSKVWKIRPICGDWILFRIIWDYSLPNNLRLFSPE